jgi:hypothetical protein
MFKFAVHIRCLNETWHKQVEIRVRREIEVGVIIVVFNSINRMNFIYRVSEGYNSMLTWRDKKEVLKIFKSAKQTTTKSFAAA